MGGSHRCLKKAVSVITEIELLSFPKLTASQEKEIRRMLAETIRTVGISDSVKRHAIGLRRDTKLKLPDAIITATAISEDAELWTADSGFNAIAGLKCKIIQPNPR